MILPPYLKTLTSRSKNSEDREDVSSSKSLVLYQDVINGIVPKVQGTTTTHITELGTLLNEAKVRPTDCIEDTTSRLFTQKDGKYCTFGSVGRIPAITEWEYKVGNDTDSASDPSRAIYVDTTSHSRHCFYIIGHRCQVIHYDKKLHNRRLERGINSCRD